MGSDPAPALPQRPPGTSFVWVGTYFGSLPGWCLGSGALGQGRSQTLGIQGPPSPIQPNFLLIAKERKLGTGTASGSSGTEGRGREKGRSPWLGAGRKGGPGWSAAADPQLRRGHGAMGRVHQGHPEPLPTPTARRPISSLSPPKAAPSHPILKPLPAQGSQRACLGP